MHHYVQDVYELNILKWPRPKGLVSKAFYTHYFTNSEIIKVPYYIQVCV
jgi:hypothetical protein